MAYRFNRKDVDFYSKGTRCSAWLYLPESAERRPIVVMAHGLGGTRGLWIDRYAERFASAGFACFLFDYRNYGTSGGDRRQLVSVRDQLADWNSAIDFIKKDARVDGGRLLLMGSSFSGGHVITLSARRTDIAAAVAQCPYTDTLATVGAISPLTILKYVPYVVGDLLSCTTGYHPVMLKLSAPEGTTALMETADYDKYIRRVPEDAHYINYAPARTVLEFVKYSPGRYLRSVNNPVYIAACLKDSLAPARKTKALAAGLPKVTLKDYDCGHFDIYFDDFFEEASRDYIAFFSGIV